MFLREEILLTHPMRDDYFLTGGRGAFRGAVDFFQRAGASVSRSVSGGAALGVLVALTASASAQGPDFAREVRPILAAHCFKCHGPDDRARKGGLRLDVREGALAVGDSGVAAVVPGRPDESELVARLSTHDPDEIMPPPAVKHPLSAEQKTVLRQWVEAGAVYQDHWAFIAPRQSPLPAVTRTEWPRNEIDHFVLARLEAEGLAPSPEANRAALVRRVSLDLTGLPPTIEEADAFIHDTAADAYEKLVDRLLASSRYGERWARRWLDVARYADTNGYEKDRPRSMWPWRDWVIRALNEDMPFDQFTVAQLAGDMLPNGREDDLVATGFHRNTMLNEEGGIDPLEFRFRAMTDRVGTTGTAWMGLTLGCAQCHTHKYDPLQHTEYFQIMAFLNNVEEPSHYLGSLLPVEQQRERAAEVEKLTAELPLHWPLPVLDLEWQPVGPVAVVTASGEVPSVLADQSVLFATPGPDQETVTLTMEVRTAEVSALRLEAMTDPSLPRQGPGRTPHGNFVLSEVSVTAQPLDGSSAPVAVPLTAAEASASQAGFPVTQAIDGRADTGWAVHDSDATLNQTKTAVFRFGSPVGHLGGTRLVVTLQQVQGGRHTIGRVRLSVPQPPSAAATVAAGDESSQRREALAEAMSRWLAGLEPKASRWSVPKPASLTSNAPKLVWQEDGSIYASGDFTKEDHYELRYDNIPAGVTAMRLEALPDARLPEQGPGIAYYEGPRGDFFVGHLTLSGDGDPVAVGRTSATAGDAGLMIDANLQSGWNGSGQTGQRHAAVLVLAQPWSGGPMVVRFQSGRHYSASLGRFRISFTDRSGGAEALAVDSEVEEILTVSAAQRAEESTQKLQRAFLMAAPEVASQVQRIRELQRPPRGQETLVMRERPADNPRITRLHHRGEYLQPEEAVEPGVPAFLPPLPEGVPANRLGFAQWLVSAGHPLTARVTVNRQWAAFFGTGLVKTLGDFGFQGELPSHPELLDWLAVAFQEDGWSLKKLHRRIVLSAVYRQESKASPGRHRQDPQNRMLSRGPRFRVEAEMVRDITLQASGLLSAKMFGPPVYPPQPAGVTETAFGGGGWQVSEGEDRHRRALYTFAKRSAPFAAANTFDAPSGEECVARRDQSNTPLQSLTLLNDTSFVEAAQALGRQALTQPEDDTLRVTHLFRRCLTRLPRPSESATLLELLHDTRQRLDRGELKAVDIAPAGDGSAAERAAWTVVARALLNLDETITKS